MANDEVTRSRTGRGRDGQPYPVNISRAVAAGERAAARCSTDDPFLLAYSLARIDLAKDVKRTALAVRTAAFNAAISDLELIKRRVLAGSSDRFEIFNTLGLIYYETKQYEKAVDVLNSAGPIFDRMTVRSKQNTLFTRGLAQYQLGRLSEAKQSFMQAGKYGHPQGAAWAARIASKL